MGDQEIEISGPFTWNETAPRTITEIVIADLKFLSSLSDSNYETVLSDREQQELQTLSKALLTALLSYPEEALFLQDLVFIAEESSKDPTAIKHPVRAALEDITMQVQSDPYVKQIIKKALSELFPQTYITTYMSGKEKGEIDSRLERIVFATIKELNAQFELAFPSNQGVKLLMNVLAALFIE